MTTDQAFSLFEQLLTTASDELVRFTKAQGSNLSKDYKVDKTLVTACDKQIDTILSQRCQEQGLAVVSEEGPHVLEIVQSGNYLTIDPIDGSLGYLEYVNTSLTNHTNFIDRDLGPAADFGLLLGIVENNQPTYGCVYNYITKEKIFISANNPGDLVREHNVRNYIAHDAVYIDQRPGTDLEAELIAMPGVTPIKQATVGLKSVYTLLNPHSSAITLHQVQTSGLWDIMPAAVAARAFGGEVCDELGKHLVTNQYIILPGNGCLVLKGERFGFVKERLL